MKITHIVHMARLPPNAMSLKRFMLRNEVLKLYRSILREIQKLPDKSHQQELQAWARNDFEAQRHCDDEVAIKQYIQIGYRQLKSLEQTVKFANS
ncbi:LYR motif-containing protein 2 isoform X4 [Oratosquilla oratoria]|uniref:LYR motif-containing protein 2 isoform X4 n=1 Tax=Oratosquilla oratoria TaxID=337810 RepID=UPI003F75D25A